MLYIQRSVVLQDMCESVHALHLHFSNLQLSLDMQIGFAKVCSCRATEIEKCGLHDSIAQRHTVSVQWSRGKKTYCKAHQLNQRLNISSVHSLNHFCWNIDDTFEMLILYAHTSPWPRHVMHNPRCKRAGGSFSVYVACIH